MKFNRNFFNPETIRDNPEKFQQMNNFYCLAAHREISEALDTVPWKIHRKEHKPEVRSNTLEELTDVFKYLMTLFQLHGFTPEEIETAYYRKSAVVEQRHLQEMVRNLQEESRIAAVDIDGVLADYPRSFVEYVNHELGTHTMDVVSRRLHQPGSVEIDVRRIAPETGCSGSSSAPGARFLLAGGAPVVRITARPYGISRIHPDRWSGWLETA